MDEDARERAARRRRNATQWPLRAYALEQEPVRDPLDRSTVNERIAAMWPLAKEAWAVAGKEIPSYERSVCPGQMVRQAP